MSMPVASLKRSTVPVSPSSVGSMYAGQFSKNRLPPPLPLPPLVSPVVPVWCRRSRLAVAAAGREQRGQRDAGGAESARSGEELAAGEPRAADAER
jgi:hypothetical protein